MSPDVSGREPVRDDWLWTIATASGQAICRPCSGNLSAETSNSTLHPPVLTATCSDAGDRCVEVAKSAVSNLKAPELKLWRKQAHDGGILAPGGRR